MRLRRSLIVMIVSMVCILATADEAGAERRQLSEDQESGALAGEVRIYRDKFGVPHIIGKTDAAVIFGLMYAQCEDNFEQLEADFIRALGRHAEVEGEKGLTNDL